MTSKKEEKFIIERKGSDHMKGSYSHNKVPLLVEFEVLHCDIYKENFKNVCIPFKRFDFLVLPCDFFQRK